MRLLINTIMLEKTRWSDRKIEPDLVDLVPRIAGETGYREVEIWQYHISDKKLNEVEAVKAAGDENGLRFPIIGAYPQLNLTGSEREEQMGLLKHLLDCADLLGAEVLKVFGGRVNTADATEEDWSLSVAFLQEVLDDADGRGITMPVESHGGTLGDCVEGMQRLMSEVDRPNLKICYQPYEFESTDKVLADFDMLQSDVIHLHLQNRTENEMSLLEEGQVDYAAYLKHVQASGFDDFLCVEFTKDIHQEGEFDIGLVLGNAEIDRVFVEKVWG